MWGLGLADVAGLAVLWVAAEGHGYICPFSLEIVTSLAGLCVDWLPQMCGSCSTGPPGMLKRENWAGLWPGLCRKTRELALARVTPLTHCEIRGVASGFRAGFSICKMGGVKGQSNKACFLS